MFRGIVETKGFLLEDGTLTSATTRIYENGSLALRTTVAFDRSQRTSLKVVSGGRTTITLVPFSVVAFFDLP